MATVTYDTASVGSDATPGGDITVSHTNAGNLILVTVGVLQNAGSGSVSGVVFAGDALTMIAEHSANNLYLWTGYKLVPSVGTFNIVATFAGSPVEVFCVGMSASGVDRVYVTNGIDNNTGNATSDTIGITTTKSGCLILGTVFKKTNDGISANNWTADISTGVISTAEFKNNRLTAAYGANAPSWSWGASARDFISTSVALAPKITGICLPY